MARVGKRLAWVLLALLLISACVTGPPEPGAAMGFEQLQGQAGELPPVRHYLARDGARLAYRAYPAGNAAPVLIILHGATAFNDYLAPLARHLAEEGVASVVAPDLRGHGGHPRRRGDVDYIGQLDDDLADLIRHLREQRGLQGELILAGHSLGGALAFRYASRMHDAPTPVRGLLLVAPFIHPDANGLEGGVPGVQPRRGRLFVLTALTAVGLTAFNGAEVLRFHLPASVPDGAPVTTRYSYRLLRSMLAEDWRASMKALPVPVVVVVGENDEVFAADGYASLVSSASLARVLKVPGLGHMSVVTDAAGHGVIASALAWLEREGR